MEIVKESIFVSAIRSFFNAFLAMIGIEIGLIVLFFIIMGFSGGTPTTAPNENFVMELLPDSEGNSSLLDESAPVLLQVDVDGIIGLDDTTSDIFETGLRLSQHTPLIKSGRIKGVLLNINSPGGVTTDSAEMYKAVLRYKEKYKVPVYVYSSGLCASGGYYIACAGDKFYASPTTLVGSVGVKMVPFFNYYGLMEKYGVKAVEISEGKYKVKYPSFTQPAQDANGKPDDASYEDLIEITKQLYDQFVTLVDASRNKAGLTKDKLINQYGAQVYLATKAAELGYIDVANVYREQALTDLAAVSGIDANTKYQVLRFKHKRSPLQTLVMSSCDMWTMKVKEWIYGFKHDGVFEGKFLYYCDYAD